MLPDSIRAVVFDAVGTVLFPEPSAAVVYSETARRFGINILPEEVSARFSAALLNEDDIDRAANWATSEARERVRWQRTVMRVLPGTPLECFDVLFDHFADPTRWRVSPESARVFRSLESRGIKLGLASNFDSRLRSVVAGLPELRAVVGRMVISSEVGVRKPGRPFYHAVADVMGEPPGRIAFVGDDPANDYHGAVAAGMTAILFDPAGQCRAPITTIRSLSELTSHLQERKGARAQYSPTNEVIPS